MAAHQQYLAHKGIWRVNHQYVYKWRRDVSTAVYAVRRRSDKISRNVPSLSYISSSIYQLSLMHIIVWPYYALYMMHFAKYGDAWHFNQSIACCASGGKCVVGKPAYCQQLLREACDGEHIIEMLC